MDDLHIGIEANGGNWRQRCNERLEILRTRELGRQDEPTVLLHRRLILEERIMGMEVYEAVQNGDVDSFVTVLEKLCEERKYLGLCGIFDEVTEAGDSMLHLAADCGANKIVELIASHYPHLLTSTNIKGDTPLHVASRARNCDAINTILSHFATNQMLITRLKNELGDTALHEAVVGKWFEGVSLLLDADRDVAHYLNKSAKSPLYLGVLTGDVQILHLLLETPFPHNQPLPQCHGNSPLHAAILECNPVMLRKILERKEEVMYLKDEDGGNALHYAAYIGYAKGVRILLNKSTLIASERNSKGYFPIHLASKKDHVKVVEEFIKKGWPNAKNMMTLKGQNILHIAAKNGSSNVIDYILKNTKMSDHLMINQKDKNGNTPLHLD
ncbi:protein ACCELERATED CELL DEATH 6 [Senna tora]|uniref:Protein ACCELERATED CELL DEATH 6 n=1 Tax=Senna tora TaxID=362788 RepID=A0A834WKT9_9FABA|nr:protein ACCELERATED CELL DEATH 6 [Senna tora]